MFIKAKDYEGELDQLELENLMNPNAALEKEKEDALRRKKEYSDKLHKELDEMRADNQKNKDQFTVEKSKFDLEDVTENYFEQIMNLTTNDPTKPLLFPEVPDVLNPLNMKKDEASREK